LVGLGDGELCSGSMESDHAATRSLNSNLLVLLLLLLLVWKKGLDGPGPLNTPGRLRSLEGVDETRVAVGITTRSLGGAGEFTEVSSPWPERIRARPMRRLDTRKFIFHPPLRRRRRGRGKKLEEKVEGLDLTFP